MRHTFNRKLDPIKLANKNVIAQGSGFISQNQAGLMGLFLSYMCKVGLLVTIKERKFFLLGRLPPHEMAKGRIRYVGFC